MPELLHLDPAAAASEDTHWKGVGVCVCVCVGGGGGVWGQKGRGS